MARILQIIDLRADARLTYAQALVQAGLFEAAFAQYDATRSETDNSRLRSIASSERDTATAIFRLWQATQEGVTAQSWDTVRSNLDVLETQFDFSTQACAPRSNVSEPCQRINDVRQQARQAEEEQRRAALERERIATAETRQAEEDQRRAAQEQERIATALAQQYRLPPFIEVPAGAFIMGSSNADVYARPDEKPQRTI
ncbi:hypothetical protein HC928_07245, partial [bacterium]|nr:hypothetical protein [bacterium]